MDNRLFVVYRGSSLVGMKTGKGISLLNQAGGLLSRELAAALAENWGQVYFFGPDEGTGYADGVTLIKMPPYRRASFFSRLGSWLSYLFKAAVRILRERGQGPLCIVTNPPIAPVLGYLAKKLRKRPYALLFYDMYPETLIRFAGVRPNSMLVRLWRAMNAVCIRNADAVVTISPQLADTLRAYCSGPGACAPVEVVPTWVDTNLIHPVAKHENRFVHEHRQLDKLTVLYAGNMGAVHDLSMLPDIAEQLRDESKVGFMIVGDGFGKKAIADRVARLGLTNVTLLPFQDEKDLPFLLAAADISLVALAQGSEGISMPSKTYYAMAAGSALLGISSAGSDLAEVIRNFECGINVEPGDVDAAVQAIRSLIGDRRALNRYRHQARRSAEQYFGREVCARRMLDIIGRSLNRYDIP